MTPESLALLANYNRWMNERIYAAAGKLSNAELAADKGAFFGSILGTLNHIAVADTVWLQRFAQPPVRFASLGELSSFPRPASLREALAADLASLLIYRQRLDDLIVRWMPELTPAHLASDLHYANMAGVPCRKNVGAVLLHFFNHHAHHRGQVSTLLFQSGVDVGVTDLVTLIPESVTEPLI